MSKSSIPSSSKDGAPPATDAELLIRDELPDDVEAIDRITRAAFADQPYSSHTEQFIVAALREAGQLTLSLVALKGDEVIGHVAASPVTLSSGDTGWHGLGPISVAPAHQQHGVGSALMRAAIARLQAMGSAGCVLLGEPAYYARFGFRADPALVLPGVPAEYFQLLSFSGEPPVAQVHYHDAFEATA
ncbi:GNAT family N-acetyltransferase [Stenotrophomonas humi]|uniref:GNAT family N-acetyltransferase n=1 Tax=Stenotrophomonas humi TaxID=405444 RepID=UPI0009FB217A|nr:N-acetyltransferase [Stenotrophomonas humi]